MTAPTILALYRTLTYNWHHSMNDSIPLYESARDVLATEPLKSGSGPPSSTSTVLSTVALRLQT